MYPENTIAPNALKTAVEVDPRGKTTCKTIHKKQCCQSQIIELGIRSSVIISNKKNKNLR